MVSPSQSSCWGDLGWYREPREVPADGMRPDNGGVALSRVRGPVIREQLMTSARSLFFFFSF